MADRLTVGGLFSGIGGWELGLERAGMEVVWHCEADPFCRRVLAKHWPDVPCYEDVCALTGADVSPVDVLCGGFPCQDISLAGKGAGIDGSRSGLWSEFARLIGELRPRYVLVENVSALLGRGFDRVLADLAALGFDAEWDPAGWEHIEVVDRDGNPPTHGNQRWYDKATGRVVQKDLRHVIERGMWPTPNARDYKGAPGAGSRERGGHQASLPGSVKDREGSGSLNPTWVEWLMGFPLGWTDLEVSETR